MPSPKSRLPGPSVCQPSSTLCWPQQLVRPSVLTSSFALLHATTLPCCSCLIFFLSGSVPLSFSHHFSAKSQWCWVLFAQLLGLFTWAIKKSLPQTFRKEREKKTWTNEKKGSGTMPRSTRETGSWRARPSERTVKLKPWEDSKESTRVWNLRPGSTHFGTRAYM